MKNDNLSASGASVTASSASERSDDGEGSEFRVDFRARNSRPSPYTFGVRIVDLYSTENFQVFGAWGKTPVEELDFVESNISIQGIDSIRIIESFDRHTWEVLKGLPL